MYRADSSRSLATLVASFPVSFWMFCLDLSATRSHCFRVSHLNMRLDFSAKLLEVLHDRSIDRSAQIRVLVGNAPRLFSNSVVYILSIAVFEYEIMPPKT
jgi:hypothetical protein